MVSLLCFSHVPLFSVRWSKSKLFLGGFLLGHQTQMFCKTSRDLKEHEPSLKSRKASRIYGRWNNENSRKNHCGCTDELAFEV